MAKTSKKVIKYLSRNDILELNFQFVNYYGGIYFKGDLNIANENSLSYLLHSVDASYFGKKLHHSLFEKASAYAYYIIKDHIFHDGNKRTGMASTILFLEKNDYILIPEISQDDIVNLAISIEDEKTSKSALGLWFKSNTQLITK
ncbi:MAG: type II toxin-antitoxin system death-on-curing family toxin [Candidatus Cloacimonetes bacterium]|nr:type II toxin-antitoxin system death-on-curing family toxin [Candidatus Cloacimonadota bacterium]MBL7085482.1 type II toxin-antitoxin system death-on-curing family toxin [Candidatus Cloacimonadota bacterium]